MRVAPGAAARVRDRNLRRLSFMARPTHFGWCNSRTRLHVCATMLKRGGASKSRGTERWPRHGHAETMRAEIESTVRVEAGASLTRSVADAPNSPREERIACFVRRSRPC